MSRFYGTVRGEDSKEGGMLTFCASRSGAVRCYAYTNVEGFDCVCVALTQWEGRGVYPAVFLYEGPIGEYAPEEA